MFKNNADAVAFGELHYFKKNIKTVTHKWIYKEKITLYDVINETKKTPCASGNYLFTKNSWVNAGRYNEALSIVAYDSWAFGFCQIATGTKMITMRDTWYYHRYGYESTFVRERGKINVSRTILQIIQPYLYMIDGRDVDYIMSKKARDCWFENLANHPIKLTKATEKKINNILSHTFPINRLANTLMKKIFV